MKIVGAWMIAMGAFSLLISFVGLRFRILWFLDEFGPFVGYMLRMAMIAAGLWLVRNGDREMTDEDPELVEGRRGWMPVAICGFFVLAVIGFVALRMVGNYRLEKQLNQAAPPAAWASMPKDQWPPLVLLQMAEFKHHSAMEAGCASLVRLPSGDVVALTAGHLLGSAGGVKPGFVRPLGELDTQRLAGLGEEIVSWKLYLPEREEAVAQVTGLFGKAKELNEEGDQLLLSLSARNAASPVKPLDVRLSPVLYDEGLRVITYELDPDGGDVHQVVYNAHRIPGVYGLQCELDKPMVLQGTSGSPVIDTNGLVVGVVTGGTLRDLGRKSGTATSFTAHPISELLPVIRAAVSQKGATKLAAN